MKSSSPKQLFRRGFSGSKERSAQKCHHVCSLRVFKAFLIHISSSYQKTEFAEIMPEALGPQFKATGAVGEGIVG